MDDKDRIIRKLMEDADKEIGIYTSRDKRIIRNFINLCRRTKDKSFIRSICMDHLR